MIPAASPVMSAATPVTSMRDGRTSHFLCPIDYSMRAHRCYITDIDVVEGPASPFCLRISRGNGPALRETVLLDSANAAELAAFWSQVLDRPVDAGASGEFAAIGLAGGSNGRPVWMFHKVPETKTAKNRAHVDLITADLAAEVDRVVRLGATRLGDLEENGARWTTLTDPAGNEFDLVAQPAG